MNDLRFALRQLLKHKGSSALAVLILALGIGGTTAVYSVADKVLLNPIPGHNTDRLVSIQEVNTVRNARMELSPPLIDELIAQSNLIESLSYYNGFYGDEEARLRLGTTVIGLKGAGVGTQFFEVLGLSPLLGRAVFAPEEDGNTGPEIVISQGLWQRLLGGDPKVIGRSIDLDETTRTVIGVMPANIRFPTASTEYWIPQRFSSRELGGERALKDRTWLTIARLKPGVRLPQLQAMLDAVAARRQPAVDGPNERWAIEAGPARHRFTAPRLQKTVWTLLAMIGALLLIASANVGNLLLSRTLSRRGEISVRMAMGAGRFRIARQLLVESLTLAGVAAALGIFVAWGGIKALEQFYLGQLPRINVLGLDWGVMGTTGLLSVGIGVLFGTAPAWLATRINVSQSLKLSERQHGGGVFQRFFHDLLVSVQVSLAVVLLTGAGLMTQSVIKLLRLDPGLEAKGLYRVLYKPSFGRADFANAEKRGIGRRDVLIEYFSKQLRWHESMVERLLAQPGIESAAMNSAGGGSWSEIGYHIEGTEEPAILHTSAISVRSGNYLETIGATLLAGRWFTVDDCAEGRQSVVINNEMARRFWPGQDPLGKRFTHADDSKDEFQVVGVIKTVADFSRAAKPETTFYTPRERGNSSANRGDFIVRSSLDASEVRDLVAKAGAEVTPRTEIVNFYSVEESLLRSTAPHRVMMWLLVSLGTLGLLLSALGIYAVLAFAVTCRTHEVGVRMAVGGQREEIQGLFLRQGFRLIIGGMALGVVAAFLAGRYIQSLLYQVTPGSPWVHATVLLTLLVAGGVACWLPARRAARTDPMEALRHE